MRGVKNMSDRDIVINEFEQWCDSMNEDCPVACLDALALLKKQEAVFKPHYIDKYGKNFVCGVECGACGQEISSTYHYCPYCGRLVKWDA